MPGMGGVCATTSVAGVLAAAVVLDDAATGAVVLAWAVAAAAAAAPTVTSGAIFVRVLAGTPALDRSATEANGRPAMIFLAVAGPMPGNASSSAWVAALMFTGAFVAAPTCARAGIAKARTTRPARASTEARRIWVVMNPPRQSFPELGSVPG